MKKTRILSLILALVLLVSMLPMGALAMTITIIGPVYDDNSAKIGDTDSMIGEAVYDTAELGDKKVVIKAKDYEDLIVSPDGDLYEIVGMHVLTNKVWEELDKTGIANNVGSVTIAPAPVAEDYKTDEEFIAAWEKWYETNSDLVVIAYGPHTHNLTKWISTPTNHWKNCVQCKEEYIGNNWHYDGNDDGKCDVCDFEIVYYKVSVPEVEGVKSVTLEGPKDDSTAAYNDKITITVEAEDGYKIQDVRVYKVRADGTKEQIVRSIKEYYKVYETVMQNFDCEIVVTCTKN